MDNNLISLLKKPALYERTVEKFWNDPHISKGMLEAHLNPNSDAASRKHEFIDKSVQWISSLVPQGAQLLDIGCGPGLYTKRFSELGLDVTGVDFSDRSINYAMSHDTKTNYVLMDYLQLDYNEQFDIITLIWCDYGALIPEERYNLLHRVYRALKPGGLFLLDVFSMKHNEGRQENTSWEIHEDGGFWSPTSHICLNAEYKYGDNVTNNRYVIIEDNDIHTYNIWNTNFDKDSLLEEMNPVGFKCVGFYSDVAGKEYDDRSKTMCVVLTK